ncbi:SAVED domain-containing protein [Gemmatimonas sp.]|uniref:SAVED domain-containing protein n=1 Tax=Gemmatimonas sp. TaxID=1962908 RepID=UPI00286E95CD|nr:SAVED domain-containing protein [Gemmatimonas sp.]
MPDALLPHSGDAALEAAPEPRRPPRFFMSHWRGNASDIAALQRALQFRGLHAWRDVDHLELGELFEAAIRRAIREEVSAFIAFVTPTFLTRPVIWNVEVPEALERHRRDPGFLIIPLFCGVTPPELTAMCARHGLGDLSAFNGHSVAPGATKKVRNAELRRVAQRTLRAGLRPRIAADAAYVPRLLLRAQPHSVGEQGVDLDLDWTAPFEAGCPSATEWRDELMPALHDTRAVLDELSRRHAHVHVQARLSAPLALGEVLSATAKYTLTFDGANGAWSTVAPRRRAPVLVRHDLAAPGTDRSVALVEVAIARDLSQTVAGHAAGLSDRPGHSVRLTPSSGASQQAVVDATWAMSAAWEVGECLRTLHDQHGVRHIHLYVAAPAEWCVLLGHTLNAVGRITVHQWHPTTGSYVRACTLGAVGATRRPVATRNSE